jgi:ferredoxin
MTASRRVRVDPRLCEAYALCIDPAPDVLDLGDYDLATCNELADESRWDDVEAAIAACPAKPSLLRGLTELHIEFVPAPRYPEPPHMNRIQPN